MSAEVLGPDNVYNFGHIAVITVHCRYLRQQIEARGLSDVELGPDEQKLRMKSEPEMLSAQQKEIEQLRDDLAKKQAELDAFRLRVTINHSVRVEVID